MSIKTMFGCWKDTAYLESIVSLLLVEIPLSNASSVLDAGDIKGILD